MNPKILGYHVIDTIYQSSRSIIYRAERESDNFPVAIKMLLDDYPDKQDIARFQHEFQIHKNLSDKIDGIVKVHAIEPFENKEAIIFDYVDGEDLTSLRKKFAKTDTEEQAKISLDLFFNIAIQIAQTLGEIHQHFVIHKDIKPHNILWDTKTQTVKIIDFGIATELSREKQSQNSSLLKGSLFYISPEQTGRMNRAIDYRTDFYSLGISLYELLSGRLPFDIGTDSMSWIHCHIAKQPLPLTGVEASALSAVSAIIFKLMAKNAEDRYKSAFGLKHDLQICQNLWKKTGAIKPFPLAQKDRSERFEIPQKLYGREQEINQLMESFSRSSEGGSHIFLVGGYSGIGKSALINEIQHPIITKNGYFIKGKFDQYQRNIPYSAISQAFQGLIKQLLTQPTEQLQQWRNKLLAVLGPNGQVLIDIIPELEQVIGAQTEVAHLGTEENQNRFNQIFLQFLQLFTKKEHPLVLFIDDLQWVDSASLKLIQRFVLSDELDYFLLLGAFRDNEVDEDHPFIRMTKELKQEHINVPLLILKPLHQQHINQLISDTLDSELQITQPLAELVMKKTAGNPFFVNQFLSTIYKNELLTFDTDTTAWCWDIDSIKKLSSADNVVELMVTEMLKLPITTQNLLQLGACVGNQFDLKTLSIISEYSLIKTAKELWPAVRYGMLITEGEGHALLVSMDNNSDAGALFSQTQERFLHDRVQQAAYSLIEESQKQQLHLKIARLLLKQTPADELENHYFDIVEHFNYSINLIDDSDELFKLAQLNFRVGKKAKDATAYQPALDYFTAAAQAQALALEKSLAESNNSVFNKQQKLLSFDISKGQIECHFLLSDADAGIKKAQQCLKTYTLIEDKIAINNLLILYYGGAGEMDKAIDIAFDSLGYFNVNMPRNPNLLQLVGELVRTKIKLGKRTSNDLMTMPLMQDKDSLAVMSLLKELVAPTYLQGLTNLLPYIILRMLYITLDHGNNPVSSFAYSGYALLWSKLDNFAESHRFGVLAMEYNKKVDNPPMEARCYFMVTSFSIYWKQALKDSLEPRKTGLQKLIETGEYFWASYIYLFGFWQEVVVSKSLDEIFNITQLNQRFAKKAEQVEPYHVHTLHQNLFKHLAGESLNNSSGMGALDSVEGEETEAVEYFTHNKTSTMGKFYHVVCRLMLHYYHEDFSQAVTIATHPDINNDVIRDGTFTRVIYSFFTCLSILATNEGISSKPKLYNKLKRKIKQWYQLCPGNMSAMWHLLKAEECRINTRFNQACMHFDSAINAAKKMQSLWLESLANEIYARYWIQKKNKKVAIVYMSEAYYLYYRWGAAGKLQSLQKHYANYIQHLSTSSTSDLSFTSSVDTIIETSSTTTSSHVRTSTQESALDIETIAKASKILSGEIVMDKLLQKLMQFLIENAGAQKGVLVLTKADTLVIEAQISVDQELLSEQEILLEDASNVSIPLIRYVARSQETVVLGNACQYQNNETEQFSNDSYIIDHKIKSILCIPLVDKTRLVGVLYLENNITTDAFISERIQVLKILSAEIAISIENARLYHDLEIYNLTLEEKVADRTSELNAMNDALLSKNNEIEHTKKVLQAQNKHITDSIEYAKKIQQAILPAEDSIQQLFSNFFIIYLPKQIVSGDFYWLSQVDNKIMVAVADCTGHGVSGAFLSMIGHTLLNKLINEKHLTEPAKVLEQLHTDMRIALQQQGNLHQANDGMDIGLCQIDLDNNKVIYAGAKRPLYIVKNTQIKVNNHHNKTLELTEIRGNYKSIGGRQKENKRQFTNHELIIQKGDMLYLSSDGYIDQNNNQDKKLGSLKLEQQLQIIANKDICEQESHLLEVLKKHQKNEPQRDDITLLGIRF
ncbi:MAG: AAA family ATPase [Pseudomonadota bacterium]